MEEFATFFFVVFVSHADPSPDTEKPRGSHEAALIFSPADA
jgi:hypothetical protein